jgi:peptidyl-prolyl cis-trans isomerase SurA
MHDLRKAARKGRTVALIASLLLAGTAGTAQTVEDNSVPQTNLDIPDNLQIFGKLDPNIRKATAIVNGTVITETDVDQRSALIALANNLQMSQLGAEEQDRLKLQVLRQLIDEQLQIQEAKAQDITVTNDEITQSYNRISGNFQKKPAELGAYLRSIGSSATSLRMQIRAEVAWHRYLGKMVEPEVNVGDEEVAGILARMKAAQGTEEYHIKEIYISATPERAQDVFNSERQVLQDIQKGTHPFEYYAGTMSEATTKSVGGDLDWVRANTLPDALAEAVGQMQIGQIAGPIEVPGGFSVIYLVDKRAVLTADSRDARLSLKQITVRFPAGTTQEQATKRAADFGSAIQNIHGCGDVEKVAAQLNAEVVNNDAIVVRQLPSQLQDIMLKLQVGQASPPFGSPQEGVRSLVLCGRDDPQDGKLPSASNVQDQLQQQRINLRADQKLRDLRRDAIIEYR